MKETEELFDFIPDAKQQKKHVYSVTEITQGIKLLFAEKFNNIWIEGEVSNFRPSSSGHWYFSLKDENALLSAVIFSRCAKEVKFKLADGIKVICQGSIDVYPPRGAYQVIIERIEPRGIGSLQLALEQLKAKLEKEGLFSQEHKRSIPYLPSIIGVITSLTGAALKDIIKVLDRRFKDVHIIIDSVKVQGDGAKEEIAQAIKDMNDFNDQLPVQEKIEVLIVGRGGGSIEDLWAFNEEVVARAIYNSNIPLISAVGHERDWTIADLVADLRAPTPSVAAELVIPRKEDLRQRLDDAALRMNNAFLDFVENAKNGLFDILHRLRLTMEHIWELNMQAHEATMRKLLRANPAIQIPEYQKKLIDLGRQIYIRMSHCLELKRTAVTGIAEKLSSLNPLNILARGYSVTFHLADEKILKDSSQVSPGDQIRTKLFKGEIYSKVTEIK
jgi:exodeoxyribonuclease VII large subunit